jgi:hypothetical protein
MKSNTSYSKGKVYRLRCRTTGRQYIGSTKLTLDERLSKHKCDYKLYKKGKHHYITAFIIIATGNFEIQLIENYPCKNKPELEEREAYYIQTVDCVNKCVPGRTDKQYREDNRERINKKHNCQCGGQYTTKHKTTHIKTKKHRQYQKTISRKRKGSCRHHPMVNRKRIASAPPRLG